MGEASEGGAAGLRVNLAPLDEEEAFILVKLVEEVEESNVREKSMGVTAASVRGVVIFVTTVMLEEGTLLRGKSEISNLGVSV